MPHPHEVAPHPLDPLSRVELARAVEIVRAHEESLPSDLFVNVSLEEPRKEELVAGVPGRCARVTLWRQGSRELFEARLDLSQDALVGWELVPGASAPMLVAQVDAALEVARSSSAFVEGLRERGLSESSEIHLEAWPFGGLLPDRFAGRRVVYTPCWERKTPTGNPYAHPIHGLYAVIDLDTLELLEIEEHDSIPVPQEPGDYRADVLEPARHVAPLEITQPQGAGFTAEGHLLRWQNWHMRVGFCPREGLLIHDVRYDDGGTERTIAHRLSMAELVIPYADPSPGSYRKNAFDAGEIFMGINTNSLTLGCDCLGEIHYIDASYVDNLGEVRTIGNAICIHEEDTGILWKHTDTDGSVEVRRGRRFVVSSIYTIDNYEYAYYWYFYQDGGIEFEVKFTGIVLTLADHADQEAIFGTAIQPGLIAPHHQHVFCARLDLDLDGTHNSVYEVDAVAPERGPLNPYGGSFVEKVVQVRDEGESRRYINPATARTWKVVNPQKLNKMGQPVAYKLVPKSPVIPVAEPTSSIGKRAGFMYADTWVTATDSDERYPAGDYPFQSGEGEGLPAWTAQGRSLDSTDVTLWHVFGITHVPRLEDWPIMPVERAGFQLTPFGFFDRNPSLDVPPAQTSHCASSGAGEHGDAHSCACS
ncbi:primary-amine oxidase [Ornithinimicrobium faecis]|uniref:primary-amine oxidase n=1 Tax=Ornithinimicrobium faecis TaxID=2934158 RepID=UPI00211768E1|nr:primary-amine oxidase [Ornithinimicrobium sp. HY1793]